MTDKLKGKAALDEIQNRLGEVFEKLGDALEQGGGSGVRDTTIETGRGPVTARVGWSVRTLGGEQEDARQFLRTKPQREAAEAREPLVDSYDEPRHYIVTAELAGVTADELSVRIESGALLIDTSGVRKYSAKVALPAGLRADGVEQRLANGILEVRIAKL